MPPPYYYYVSSNPQLVDIVSQILEFCNHLNAIFTPFFRQLYAILPPTLRQLYANFTLKIFLDKPIVIIPIIVLLVCLIVVYLVQPIVFMLTNIMLLFIRFLGFGIQGIVRGSIAAAVQSVWYGGYIPARGLFALLQSIGALARL